jgi:hypothetical protein
MNELKYEPVFPVSRTELVRRLESNDPKAIADALYSAAKYEEDWKWVQNLCLEGLTSSEVLVRWAAATCLGDLAWFRRLPLDFDTVVSALEAATKDPQVAGPAADSLSMVREFLSLPKSNEH